MKVDNNFSFQLPIEKVNHSNDTSKLDFKDFLSKSINQLNSLEQKSNELDYLLATGEIDNIHDVMIASEKAEIGLQFAIEIRNKIINAYEEIMRIQI